MNSRRLRIGIDTGGTFTDVVAFDEAPAGSSRTKTPSTPPTRPTGSWPAIASPRRSSGVDRRAVAAVSHGTTVATNQLLEGKVEHARLHHHRGLRVHPRDRPPVGARRLRQLLLLGEAGPHRAGPPGQDGRRPARPHRRRGAAVRRARAPSRTARWFRDRGINTHRRLLPALLRQPRPRAAACATSCAREHPDAVVSISSEVLREYREYERSMTTLVDAAVKPKVAALRPLDPAAGCTPATRPGDPVLRDEVQRRRAVGRRGRAPADHHGAVRPGGRRARGRADRRAPPASTGC